MLVVGSVVDVEVVLEDEDDVEVGSVTNGATVVGAVVVGAIVVGAVVVGAIVVVVVVVVVIVVVGTTFRVAIALAVATFDCVPMPS